MVHIVQRKTAVDTKIPGTKSFKMSTRVVTRRKLTGNPREIDTSNIHQDSSSAPFSISSFCCCAIACADTISASRFSRGV